MPPRRKPTSTNKKKAATKLKRAVKRGDVPPPPKQSANPKKFRGPPVSDAVQSSRKLQSAFITLPPLFLEQTRVLAATLPLSRPIPNHSSVIAYNDFDVDSTLTCPRRPKWKFDMSKIEVEHNEEGLFRKWLAQTDELVEKWQKPAPVLEAPANSDHEIPPPPQSMPRSTTYFERNLEVWRQLWRVTEISQIILVLLDSRAPLLHFPPSLATYLSERRVILVLTKVDISGPIRADAWTRYFNIHYPGLRVVQVESYVEKEARSGHQGRKQYEPHLPESFRHRLVEAIKQQHAEMLQPPEKVKANPAWLERWKPSIKRDVNWEQVLNACGGQVGTAVGGAAAPRAGEDESADEEPKFLTIGLIGQPNVGKSSLLNALFGAHKVRASKTPGKTKHFQTLFWSPDVRLVDCPGLVMPNFIPMEMQVLLGILPISRVSAVPSCIHYAAQLLPLEKVYHLAQPVQVKLATDDKRTWRDGERPGGSNVTETPWTATDLLIGYADAKGWVTAKAGRPDIHRAGNAILRSLAEGRVAWAFWPPGMDLDPTSDENHEGLGIWIPRGDDVGTSSEEEESEEGEGEQIEDGDGATIRMRKDTGEDSESDSTEAPSFQVGAHGRFGALQDIDDPSTSEGERSDEDSDESS
ncbi:hypothetical protein B0H10DRAFT_2019215 [Mycena sp. CBHHK59/15]|nr:hypothetical protein B0H10DRAFT_2019215 [Mycena sp. CBHHK59/15]